MLLKCSNFKTIILNFSVSCEASRNMNRILKSKLREFAQELYEAVSKKESEDEISSRIKAQMATIYR